MIVPDINVLVYAYNDGVAYHRDARHWWETLLNGTERVGIPWVVLTGFVRLMTHPRVLASPVSPEQALAYVRVWYQYPPVVPLNPGTEHLKYLQHNLEAAGAGGQLVSDAHIAALAMEYQAEVHSTDSDFSRFPGLRWRNPLRSR